MPNPTAAGNRASNHVAKSALAAEVEGLEKNLTAETDALADRIAGKLLRGRAA